MKAKHPSIRLRFTALALAAATLSGCYAYAVGPPPPAVYYAYPRAYVVPYGGYYNGYGSGGGWRRGYYGHGNHHW